MKIHHTGFGGVQPPIQNSVHGPHGAASGQSTNGTSEAGFTPSSEFVQLLDQVKSQPDIRADVVARVSQRLQEGYYDTPASFAATAEQILHPE